MAHGTGDRNVPRNPNAPAENPAVLDDAELEDLDAILAENLGWEEEKTGVGDGGDGDESATLAVADLTTETELEEVPEPFGDLDSSPVRGDARPTPVPEPLPEPLADPDPISAGIRFAAARAASEPVIASPPPALADPEPETVVAPPPPPPTPPARTRSATTPPPTSAPPGRLRPATVPPAPPPTPFASVPPTVDASPPPAPASAFTTALSPARPASAEPTPLDDHDLFKRETQALARAREWKKLAALTSDAIDTAPWAALPEAKAALLLDLARIYRDRLEDASSAEEAFRRLTAVDPAHTEAVAFLAERYRARDDWRALYDLYGAAVDATWDPHLRLEWTRESVEVARSRLFSVDLVMDAWERLFRLGDAVEETSRELSLLYRRNRRWDRLADFLLRKAAMASGAARIVILREVVEAFLSGTRDHEQAAARAIEPILAERPDDALALLSLARVLARRKDWDRLADLGQRPLSGQSPAAVLDFRRVVADALWTAGELERSVAAHERVLEVAPDDADALDAKEEYLRHAGKTEELVAFLSARARRTADPQRKLRFLVRAAELAERGLGQPARAVELWEEVARLDGGRDEALPALAVLYETLGDAQGLARTLEAQLALSREPAIRIDLLRRLGSLYAHRLGDDARAEELWLQILAAVPDDRDTFDELVALHRRRGDFEGLDRTLSRQAWRPLDDSTLRDLWRRAARNLEENRAEAARTARAWLRVLDLSPDDAEALAALPRHHAARGDERARLAALEDELRTTVDPALRTQRALAIASLHETAGARAAAAAAYERVLRWEPTSVAALEGLLRVEPAAADALEAAAVRLAGVDEPRRIALLHRAADVRGKNDALARFFTLRRVLGLTSRDPEIAREAVRAAEAASAWHDLAALLADLAASSSDRDQRARYLRDLALLYETRLSDPVRAALALEAIGREPLGEADRARLERLLLEAGRHEELLALLDVYTRAELPLETRRAALRRRAEICEKQLGDEIRAFHENARLLALDPRDSAALAEARRLAAARGLWLQLDALYAELWDRADNDRERLELSAARHDLCARHLGDPRAALEVLLVSYRIDPVEGGVEARLLQAADELEAWDRVFAAIEGRIRAAGAEASPDELVAHAARTEARRKDAEHALELVAEAFVRRPSSTDLEAELFRLAETTGRFDRLAAALRRGAARSGDPVRMLAIYPRLATVYEVHLGRTDEALDVHRRILQLLPTQLDSLEVVIRHQREAGLFRELRDSLDRWLEITAQAAPAEGAAAAKLAEERIARMLEAARLSQEALGDPEAALAAYARILEVVPDHAEALAGVRSLTEGPTNPKLELRRVQIELAGATGERRVELSLRAASLLRDELDDLDGAVAVLGRLVDETGAAGPGFEPLAALLTKRKSWAALLDLLERRAEALPAAERVAALERVLAEADEHPEAAGPERIERVSRRLLELEPGHADARRRQMLLLRTAGRHQELAQALSAVVAGLPEGELRRHHEDELLRILDRALGRTDEARRRLEARLDADPGDAAALLALASMALRAGDLDAWLAFRERHAKLLSPADACLSLCHLAEACSEDPAREKKAADYYRAARALDPACPVPAEALKAIGRRARTRKPKAALLPDEDEAQLSWPDRAERLRRRAEAASRPDEALFWLRRAVAVDPDAYHAWDDLARLFAARGDHAAALEAQRGALWAFERKTAPSPELVREHAERIQRVAEALTAAGDDEGARRMSRRAWELLPTLPAAAIAVAEDWLEAGRLGDAFGLFDRLLRAEDPALTDSLRLHALYRRGELAARLGRRDEAVADLRQALRGDPLHGGALNALAEIFVETGRVAAAAQHHVQALLVTESDEARAPLYARLGRLWEDHLGSPDEALACYELALRAGVDERDLMMRALRLYRTRDPDRALEVIQTLLDRTTDEAELAALWVERGDVLAERDPERAQEAYDMALSYDPGHGGALAGLSRVLERRGEWDQLIELHESRLEGASRGERLTALRTLARIARERLDDEERARRYLSEVLALDPRREDWEELLRLLGPTAPLDERRAALAGLMATPGPRLPHAIDLAHELLARGEKRGAWALLSPLLAVTGVDRALRSTLAELRKEFEKSDGAEKLTADAHRRVRHPDVHPALLEILGELDERLPLGPTSTEAVGASGTSKMDGRSAHGKTFQAIAERLGMPEATLYRALELPTPFAVLDADGPQIVVKAELLQLIALAETNFLFSMTCELSRPGARVVWSLPPEERPRLVGALLATTGRVAETPETGGLAARIREGVPPEVLAAWGDRLGAELGDDALADPSLPSRFVAGLGASAQRVGLVASPDLRAVSRLLCRLDDSLPKLITLGQPQELEDYLDAVPPLSSLLAFAASPEFGQLVA